MEEAVTDQIVKTTKIHIDQTAVIGGYEIGTGEEPRNPNYQVLADSQRQLGIDGDIVDIQTNQI